MERFLWRDAVHTHVEAGITVKSGAGRPKPMQIICLW